MFKKNGQFSVEFLLIFVFIMSIVSVLIVILGTISIEISLDEKRQEVDDFANSILKEFEIMQSVEGGYYRNFKVPIHFMERFNIKVDGDYLIISDLYNYESEDDFIRYYKIPGDYVVDTNFDTLGNFIISLCKNFPNKINSVDFFYVSGINDDYCFDKLVNDYVTFSSNSSDLTIVDGNTRLNLELTSNVGTNTIFLRDFESSVLLEHDFGQFDAPLTLNFETNLTADRVFISFKDPTNVNTFNITNSGIIYWTDQMIPVPTLIFNFTMGKSLSLSEASFIGEDAGDSSGESVSGVGDVNGDGFDDFLIGAYSNDGGGINTGKSYLFFGKNVGWNINTDLSLSDASFIGEISGDNSGQDVSGVGDVNGDGFDDFLIGADSSDVGGTNVGQNYLILGKSSGWSMNTNLSLSNASFIGESPSDRSGEIISGVGDVNADGFDDFLIGVKNNDDNGFNKGKSYLILGRSNGWNMDTDLSLSNASFTGEFFSDYSGHSISGVGDVNGDGFDDFIIGAFGNDDGGPNAGQSYLIFGKSSGWNMDTDLSLSNASFIGENSDDESSIVSGVGDVNGDGFDDFLIGGNGNDDGGSNAGQSYLILGKSSGWNMDTDLSLSDASFIGEIVNDRSGVSVSGAGDVNGDSFDDFLIGTLSGKSYLILGRSSGWNMGTDLSLSNASFTQEAGWDYAGLRISGVGDVNGDNFDDFLIGAYGNDDGGSNAGKSYLVLNIPTIG